MHARLGIMSLVLGLVAAAFLGTSGTPAGEKKAKDDKNAKGKTTGKEEKAERPKFTEDADVLGQLKAAFDLVQYGRKHKAAEVLLAAARVIGTTDVTQGKLDKEKVQKPYDAQQEADNLIDEALKLSKDPAIKALAKSTRAIVAAKERGPLTGTRAFGPISLGPKQSWMPAPPLVLRPNEFTRAVVISHDGADMDLYCTGVLTGMNFGSDTSGNPNAQVTFTVGGLPAAVNFRVFNFSSTNTGRFTLIVSAN